MSQTANPSSPPPILSSKEDMPSYAKWREAGRAGFQIVPDLLLKNQDALGLSATDVVVLLNVLMHWWFPDQKPFPRSTTIARRMGVTARTVQRALGTLQKRGILTRVKVGENSSLDPEPLVQRLAAIAKDDRDYRIRTNTPEVA